jgi:hypothetical protein
VAHFAPGKQKEAMNSQKIRAQRRTALARQSIVYGICLAGASALAQDAVEQSDAVDQSRRARKQAIDRNLYNLKAGPVLMRFEALMGFEFNDNPQLVEDPKEIDFAFHPELDVAALWALNSRNALSFNLGLGYIKYINNTDLDRLIIAPSSEIALDIYTGDFTINVHDRISYSQNPISDPTVSGTGDFGGFENTAGFRVDWDLNKVVLSLGYDHYNFVSTSDGIQRQIEATNAAVRARGLDDVQDRSAEQVYARAAFRVSPAVQTGLEAGGSATRYASDFFHDNTQVTIGAFLEAQVTKDLKGRAAGGYVRSDFDDNALSPAPDSVNDFYAELSAEHQLNQYISHRLALGREARAGVASELVTMWYARYQNDWMIHRLVTLHTTALYENGKERSGISERFWRAGGGIGATVPLSRKLSTTASYQCLYKDSDQLNRDYLQNLVTLEFRYVF